MYDPLNNELYESRDVSLFEKHGSKLYSEDTYYNNYIDKISKKTNGKKEEELAQANVEDHSSVIGSKEEAKCQYQYYREVFDALVEV